MVIEEIKVATAYFDSPNVPRFN